MGSSQLPGVDRWQKWLERRNGEGRTRGEVNREVEWTHGPRPFRDHSESESRSGFRSARTDSYDVANASAAGSGSACHRSQAAR